MAAPEEARPKARTADLIVERLPDEVLVYDLDRHRAHTLNHTAATVWELCDGSRGVDHLAQELSRALGAPLDRGVVELALERLHRAHLLEEGTVGGPLAEEHTGRARPDKGSSRTRRQVVRRLAELGIALPMVMTIVSPLPAQAATRITPSECFWYFDENSGKCCTNGRRCIRWFGNRGICYGAQC